MFNHPTVLSAVYTICFIKSELGVLHLTNTPVLYAPLAQMAELVDALASGASVRMDVEVQVLFWAPNYIMLSPFHDVRRCNCE